MIRDEDRFHDSGIAAEADSNRNTVKRFDEATLAAAYSIRDAERRCHEGTLAQADADAIWEAACAVAPHARGIITLLSNLDHLPYSVRSALPELVNDTNIDRITRALRFIDNELTSYFADSDTAHLTSALDTGLQSFHQALRRSFGYWHGGRDAEIVTADIDLRAGRRDKLAGKLLTALRGWIPGSRANFRGSLACGAADDYSDIDICWVVPDQDFTEAVDTLGAALSQVTAVLWLRTDPDFARSAGRRVVFARMCGLPLFWRVDIDIRAGSVAADDLYDAGNPPAATQDGRLPRARSRMPSRPSRRRPAVTLRPLGFCCAADASG